MTKKKFIFILYFFIIFFLVNIVFEDIFYTVYFFGLQKVNNVRLYFKRKNYASIIGLVYAYQKLEEKYNKLSFLYQEALFLTRFSNNKNTFNRRMVTCEIVGYIKNKKNKFFFINCGSRDGVKKDMSVVSGVTILGKITNVYDHYSRVISLDNSTQYIPVKFENSFYKGVLRGNRDQKDGTMKLFYAVKDDDNIEGKKIFEGARVFTSGKGLSYPPGFYVGTVFSCDYNGEIIITSGVDLKNIDYCSVILDNTPNENFFCT